MVGMPRFGFVVEYVRDIETARKFYTDVMGLTVQREHPTFVQFDSFALATDEPMGGETDQEVYWLVDDVDAAYRAIASQADVCLPLTDVPFGRVFGVKDTEGRPRYLLQLATRRPSQAV